MVQTKRADFNGLAKVLGVSPVSVRIMSVIHCRISKNVWTTACT